MTKALIPSRNSNTKTPPNALITQRLLADVELSSGEASIIQLVWLKRFTGS